MIIQTISTVSAFRDAFRDAGRKDQFTYDGLTALYDFLEDVYSDSNYELDVIALCCDFTEYTLDELFAEYSSQSGLDSSNDISDWLNDRTLIIQVSNGNIIVQGF